MPRFIPTLRSFAAGCGVALFVSAPVFADDSEVFRSTDNSPDVRPNVLFVIDTSGSMATLVTSSRPPYDPSTTYSGSCNASSIYYVSATALPARAPTCGGRNPAASFSVSANTCGAMTLAFANGGEYFIDFAAQYRTSGANKRWRALLSSDSSDAVECMTDNGQHGQTAADSAKWIQEADGAGWTTSASTPWKQTGGGPTPYDTNNSYVFYSANYLNWANMAASTWEETRLEIVSGAAKSLANSLNNVNIGLMRYNDPPGNGNTEGGSVLQEIGNVSSNRAAFNAAIDTLRASGNTPLTETLYEAQQYFAGRDVDFGNNSPRSVNASRVGGGGNTYQSPIQYQCQRNYVVYLTDGLPTTDTSANTKIPALPNFSYLTGRNCGNPPGSNGDGGQCMDDLAGYMNDVGVTVAGAQHTVQTYTIGFGNDPDLATTGTPYLNAVAAAGGTGQSFTAADSDSLTTTLQRIFNSILDTSSTFVTPAISVNAFNRAQTQDDLYYSVFKPALGVHWPGNLKKYQLGLSGGVETILDSLNQPAVSTSGFFQGGTTSFWSPAPDGGEVTDGGAVSNLPDPGQRRLYTDVVSVGPGSTFLTAANVLDASNSNITDALMNTGGDAALHDAALNWARGLDVNDENGDGSTSDAAKPFMGDPMHGKPAVVTYGGTAGSPDPTDTVVFQPTNDGFLHAINAKNGANGGKELWGFIPKELLYRLKDLYQDPNTATRTYGLDGDVQVLKYDVNQNGIVEAGAGDRVYLFFGMRMGHDLSGNSYYYALDVTDRTNPKLLWVDGPGQLPGLGQTWSPPTITRVKAPAGAPQSNAQKFVLIFGGGYDMAAETPGNTSESSGNAVFMVDAETGARLWSAGSGTSSADLKLANMTNAIPGQITVLDTDGDLFADRMYAADLGGRIWRFDIVNGASSLSTFVAGNAIATLGRGDVAGSTAADNRRFYNSPDIALVQKRGADPYYNIAIGSGYRGHPLNTSVIDRFYSIRDKKPFAHLDQSAYNAITPVLDSALTDITSNPAGAAVPVTSPGWKLSMTLHGGGEKILGNSTTVNNVVLFTSFEPAPAAANNPCIPTNINRVYAVSVSSGRPALDFNDDGVITNADLAQTLNQSGIVGEVNVAFLRSSTNGGSNTNPNAQTTVCVAGVEVMKKCVSAGGTVRTFWRRDDSQ